MKIVSNTVLFATVVAVHLAAKCNRANAQQAQLCNSDLYSNAKPVNGTMMVYGNNTDAFGAGTVTTYIQLANDTGCNGPIAVGFELNMDIKALPNATSATIQPPPGCAKDYFAPGCFGPMEVINPIFPGSNRTFNPFVYLMLDWETVGHEPVDVYSAPHFDSHFWLTDPSVAQSITPGIPPNNCGALSPEAFLGANQPISVDCFPAKYVNMEATAPNMGNHYINPSEPQIQAIMQGHPNISDWYEPSFIFGGWKGQIVFMEPMIRTSFLQDLVANKSSTCMDIPGPAQYQKAGYYPTKFCVTASTNGTINVEMNAFKLQANDGNCNSTNYSPMSYINAIPVTNTTYPSFCNAPMLQTKANGPQASPGPGPAPAPPSSAIISRQGYVNFLAAFVVVTLISIS